MLGDISIAEEIYIACGYTDMRKSIDGLAAIVQEQFQLNPFSKNLYLFCGKRRDRLKALYGKAMDLFFFTRDWRMETLNGHAVKLK
jgi:transposase